MTNLKPFIDSLLTRYEESANRESVDVLQKRVLFFPTGKAGVVDLSKPLVKQRRMEKTNWSVVGSVGYDKLGFRVGLLHVSLTARLTPDQVSKLLGRECFYKGRDNKLRVKRECKKLVAWSGGNTFTLKVSPLIPMELLELLVDKALKSAGVPADRVLPAHPSWIFEHGKGINIAYALPGSPTFGDVFGEDRLDIFYRAGKDLWKVGEESRKVKLQVVETADGHDDGNFWIKGDSRMDLVRALTKDLDENHLLIKGRSVQMPTLEGPALPPNVELREDVDGWISTHNIKWAKDSARLPEVMEIDLQYVQDEDHSHDDDEAELRKFSIIGHKSLLCKYAKTRKGVDLGDVVDDKFKKQAFRVQKLITNFPKDWKVLADELSTGDHGTIRMSQVMKCALGLGTEQDAKDVHSSMLRKLRSVKIHGAWLSAIAQQDVERSTIWVSPDTYDRLSKLYGVKVTTLRYPITGYQSFFTVTMVPKEGLPENLAVFNGEDAKYLQLDGDDHILLSRRYSAFEGGEEVANGRTAPKRDLGDLSVSELYFSGAIAQSLIGHIFNGMSATKSVDPDLSTKLAGMLDLLAQSIKKPYAFDPAAELELIDKVDESKIPAIAKIAMKRDMELSAYKAWGATIPKQLTMPAMPDVEFGKANVRVVNEAIKMFEESVIETSTQNGRKQMDAARNFHARTMKWMRANFDTKHTEKVASALETYAAIAFEIRKWIDENSSALHKTAGYYLQTMQGDMILAGVSIATGAKYTDSDEWVFERMFAF